MRSSAVDFFFVFSRRCLFCLLLSPPPPRWDCFFVWIPFFLMHSHTHSPARYTCTSCATISPSFLFRLPLMFPDVCDSSAWVLFVWWCLIVGPTVFFPSIELLLPRWFRSYRYFLDFFLSYVNFFFFLLLPCYEKRRKNSFARAWIFLQYE